MVEVFAIPLLNEESFLVKKQLLINNLPESSRNFYSRFKSISALQRSLLAELLSRFVLGHRLGTDGSGLVFSKSDNGKPYLNNYEIHFNLSHSGNWVVMAMDETEVGIDVEIIRNVNFHIAERFFSEGEVSSLNSKEGNEKLAFFFDLWTIKESFLKLIGTGLTRSLSSFTVYQNSGEFVISESGNEINSQVFFKQYDLSENYKLSVCSCNKNFNTRVELIPVNNLLKS